MKAVDGVDFSIARGETLGLVGESGCGKTTTGRCILRLEKPTAGRDPLSTAATSPGSARRELVGLRRRIQVIFQDPYSSLNPRMKVGDIIAEPMHVHGLEPDPRRPPRQGAGAAVGVRPRSRSSPTAIRTRCRAASASASASPARSRSNPEFIVCDEAVSALDVSIQAQVVNLLEDLREQFDLTYLFIAHDLSVVRHLCQRVAVMYLGRIVEMAESDELFDNPLHPYTQALLAAVPVPDPTVEAGRAVPAGAAARCPARSTRRPAACSIRAARWRSTKCKKARPELREMRPGHWVACSEVQLSATS